MASRRDELNAYTFAKRRTLASFIQPSPTGSEEGAPRPLRAVVPGSLVAVLLMAGFGAWGMLKPVAPPGWSKPGEKIIIASDSTTRYVVLRTDGKAQLHPVLNMASAKLLLDAGKGEVVKVAESVLDNGDIPHGATIGIPYAPDRLPKPDDAGAHKRWAVCERPGGGGRAIQKAAFVLAQREQSRTDGSHRLHGGQLLYVEGPAPAKTRYVVDAGGTAYEIANQEQLLREVVGGGTEPRRVSKQWLDTLHRGSRVTFPRVDGKAGTPAHAPGRLPAEADKVGMVLQSPNGGRAQFYVVLPGRVAPVSDFTARLLLTSPDLASLGQTAKALEVHPSAIEPKGPDFASDKVWPKAEAEAINSASAAKGARSTLCAVLRSVDSSTGRTTLSTWAGPDFPATLPTGSSSAYVTPGSGLLFRQFQGSATKVGPLFLVTDTGLRYVLQTNGDSAGNDSGIGGSKKKNAQEWARDAQARLGYANVVEAPVPAAWSEFLPTGPRLSRGAANQPQGS